MPCEPMLRSARFVVRPRLSREFGSRGWDYFSRWKAEGEPAPPPSFPTAEDGVVRPRAFFDIEFEGAAEKNGRIVFELATDIAPKTCDNFMKLCKGTGTYAYRGTTFHHVKSAFVAGGDVIGDGGGGHAADGLGEAGGSSGGRWMAEENFFIRHSEPGVLSMSQHGVDCIGSQFCISLVPNPQLDGRNVAFGRVVEGLDTTVKAISDTFAVKGAPLAAITVTDSGVLNESA